MTLTPPLTDRVPRTPPPTEDTLEIAGCAGCTLLIVDGDRASRRRTARALDEAGYRTLAASDVESALELSAFAAVDGIVMDPSRGSDTPRLELDMIDALRAAEELRSVPLMLVSALHDPKQRVEGLRRGAGDYLAKPFECEEIVFRLSRLLPADRPQSASETQLGRLVRTGDLTSPAAVDRYEAHRVVGRGAMGVVLAGVDPRLERQVAIKILDPVTYRPQRESGQHHALHEGSALARFDHPNIVKIYDTGMAEGLPFLVMELVDGESLATRLERGPLELRPAVNLARAVARALETAHGDGWLHRDIKPANILLASGGAIKVTDFGLASLADDAEESGGERIFGTPGYTPPECLIGDPHTRHGDLFALGSVLYFCLCGRSPFAAATLPARLAATLAGRYQPLPDEIPRPLRKLIDQLLASDPSKRPESARGVARRLEWIAEALAVPDLPNEDLEPAETLPVQIH